MPYVTINGKQIFVPEAVSGNELNKIANPNNKSGRRGVIGSGFQTTPVEKNKKYYSADLKDNKGNPVRLTDIPDRTKGSWISDIIKALFPENNQPHYKQRVSLQSTPARPPANVVEKKNDNPLFWGNRSELSKRIILEQCQQVSEKLFGGNCEIDFNYANTFKVNKFILPAKWKRMPGVSDGTTSLAIVFPTEYPKIAPIGFYIQATISELTSETQKGHLYGQAYHNADKLMLDYGWKWYCVYVNEGSWQPAVYRKPMDWTYGDNLWTYFHLIQEALTTSD